MTITKAKLALFAMLAGTFGTALGGGAAVAYQGHMFNALGNLRAARAQLNAGLPDKAGHRVQAIGLVDQAIGQVNAAIAAGSH